MKFKNKQHRNFFVQHCTDHLDSERKAAFYVIGLSHHLMEHFGEIYNERGIFSTEISWPWLTGSDQKIYLFALNLYNGYVSDYPNQSTPKYLFTNFDDEMLDYFFYAMKILESKTHQPSF